MKKKILAVLLASAMALSLSACGKSDSGSSSDTSSASESSGEAATPSDDAIQLTFWHAMGGTNGEMVQELVDDFNASQDEIFVTAEYQGSYDDTTTKLKAAMQSGGFPDICQMYDVGTKFMYDSGYVIPVEDMFETTGYDPSTVMDVITSYYTVDGKQYSMPFNVSTPMLYYNKDVFEAAGLDPEVAPTTYDEVLQFAKQIVESGAADVGYSMAIYGWFFEQQLAGMAATYGDNDNGRSDTLTSVTFDQDGSGEAILSMWKDLYDSGYFANYGTTTDDTQTAFFSGSVGMIIESTAILKNATNSSDFEIGTAYLPRVEEAEDGGVIIGGASLWLMDTGDTEKEEAAWKFIEFCTTAEEQAKWSMGTGYFAINPDAYEVDDMVAYLEEWPNFETAINQLNDSPVNTYTAGVLSGVQTESRLIFNEVIPKLYEGSLSVTEAVDELATRVNEAITTYNASLE